MEFASGGVVEGPMEPIPAWRFGCEFIVPASSEKRREQARKRLEELNRALLSRD